VNVLFTMVIGRRRRVAAVSRQDAHFGYTTVDMSAAEA
jgi:hypothetical protein